MSNRRCTTNRSDWIEQHMVNAIRYVIQENHSIRDAATRLNTPASTLGDRIAQLRLAPRSKISQENGTTINEIIVAAEVHAIPSCNTDLNTKELPENSHGHIFVVPKTPPRIPNNKSVNLCHSLDSRRVVKALEQISPISSCDQKIIVSRKRRTERSEILTSTLNSRAETRSTKTKMSSCRDRVPNLVFTLSMFQPEIVKRQGYPIESHYITTKDGYTLTIFRIPHGKAGKSKNNKKPVFVQHGFGSNCRCFVNRKEKSLGFILADAGYDVWLGNFRGTAYSNNHSQLSIDDQEFWNFSVHEHGIYDLPAQLSYVRTITRQKLLYIGYSLGTMAMYVYGVTYPEQAADQIKIFINLAPSTYLNNSRSVVKYLVPYWHLAEPIVQKITNGYIYARIYSREFLKSVCYPYPVQLKICQIPDMLLAGFNYEHMDPETLPIYFIQNPDWVSIKGFTHLVQFALKDRFESYDYGEKKNNEIYGTPHPIFYNLTKMKIPTYFIRAHNDLVTTKENVESLYNSLPDEAKPHDIYVIDDENFNHYDFLTSKDVVPLLYNHILEVLKMH
ncbi:hypothetical protein FQR65_LT11701 [Abscondita terminalis]|nr:hypothetical protein FQR65_LT11701 [Abscondita terminalis]